MQLRELRLEANLLSCVALAALAGCAASAGRPLARLTTLTFSQNRVSDTGVALLAAALNEGALPRLNSLDLSGNALGAPTLTELEDTLLQPRRARPLSPPTHNLRVVSVKSK